MEFITSANIACGGHAGDEAAMERIARLALARGVRIGAHPGYPDRANFGRVAIPMPAAEIERMVRGADRAARHRGAQPRRPHRSRETPRRPLPCGRAECGGGARHRRRRSGVGPPRTLFGLAGSPMLDVWRQMGMQVAAEAFADRRYEPDGTLRSRQFPDALIANPRQAAAQALRFARAGKVQTICVHGDTPGAVDILRACREALARVAGRPRRRALPYQ